MQKEAEAEQVKTQNIIDMALGFAAIVRVFEIGSAKKIKEELGKRLHGFINSSSLAEYDRNHREFCEWFIANISTAEGERGGKIIKRPKPASYGQAAKVIDVVMKVCVYYCSLPSHNASSGIVPWLHAAVDTKLLGDLKRRYSSPKLSGVQAIGDVGEAEYQELQELISRDIAKSFNSQISPVQYDDIMWRRLNR